MYFFFTKSSAIKIAPPAAPRTVLWDKPINRISNILSFSILPTNVSIPLPFSQSNLGALLAIKGADVLKAMQLPSAITVVGIIFLTGFVNLFVGSSSAKWALLGPIFVPMLYSVNSAMTPDLVAAAYRVADSSTNIITPMMTYAGVILAFMRKYHKNLSFGDLIALMIPYSLAFLVVWTCLLIAFFTFNIPFGF